MTCPHCGYGKTIVKDSRTIDGETYRARRCPACRKRFYTFEAVDDGNGVMKMLQKYHNERRRRELQKDSGRDTGS